MPEADATPPQSEDRPHKPKFIVVGIGASAGGLDALKTLLSQLPNDTGMAYVVVVHLSPEHESHLAEILQRSANMPVQQVRETTAIEPNHVYVIPPDANLSTIDTHLRLTDLPEKRRERMPIDHFLRTLAETHGDFSIGIILTGTGCDGVGGLRHIKENGGLVLVQDPDEAEFDAMPQNAAAAGVADRILELNGISSFLRELSGVQHQVVSVEEQESAEVQQWLGKILALVRARTGHDFTRYKKATVLRRVRRRLQVNRIADLEAYHGFLRQEKQEVRELQNDLLITVTNFFRNPEAFDILEREYLPELVSNHPPDKPIRIWSVGCATGEEAYSLAILCLEHFARMNTPPELQVFASDLHQESLENAREGFYPKAISADITAERLQRWFVEEPNGYRVKKEVRETIVFAEHNLLKDPPFSGMDLVSCRNLLIYLQRSAQQQAYQVFHYALRPGGYLFLGASENADGGELFRSLNKPAGLYARSNKANRDFNLPLFSSKVEVPDRQPQAPLELPKSMSVGKLHQDVVEQFAPPSVLIDRNQNILHYSRQAGQLLRQPGGEPTHNIFKLLREELRVELRACLNSISKGQTHVNSRPILLNLNGEKRKMVLRVRGAAGADAEADGAVLVIFDDMDAGNEDPRGPQEVTNDSYLEMEKELEQTRERLRQIVEEQEVGQEEMRASNEELQSTNEELRSTMEELETSKEELQSMNEELSTVNQENRLKVEELSQLSNDLQNLLASTNIATIFLDRGLHILRYTPRVAELFNVKPTDRGRKLTDFTHRLAQEDDICKDAREVLQTLHSREREVRSQSGEFYLMQVLPYRTEDDRIEGVVVTFVEISRLKKAEEDLRAALEEIKDREKDLKALNENLEERVEERTRELRKLAQHLTQAEQQERRRIAQILHDDLQQVLCAVQTKFHLIRTDIENLPVDKTENLESLDEATEWLSQGIEMSRRLTLDLNPPILKSDGLAAALQWLGNQVENMHNLKISLDIPPDLPPIGENTRVMLFQTVRELLLNVVKHAGVDRARINCYVDREELHIVVADNGQGFEVTQARAAYEDQGGFGLFSVEERMHFFGGRLNIQSKPGQGTRNELIIPLEMAQS